MAEIAEVTPERTLKLPPSIAARLRPSDRFVIWVEGDVLHLKRITPASVTDITAEAPAGEELSPEEVNDIVHKVRRERRLG
ncbi:MAG TPA: hypothetical protein PLJ35_17165 [Anaerolineae bacterium]|nr:hypothetical protein [Anaerolineae bacterium]HOR00544.1 hypothetical protein [Anaerolineae bacterium]HPL28709.1 hypothetical protein [Anaerolineae bacterium]